MGLLDDAIREHLDLKRRHGADPTEVERAEREALGPVRRAPESGPGVETAPEQSGPAYDHEQEEGWDDEPFADTPAPRSRGRRAAEPEPDLEDDALHEDDEEPEPEPEARPSRLSRLFGKPEPEPEPEYDDEAEPEYDDEAEPHPARGHADQDTVAHDLEDEPAAPEPPKDEDVLEETPEFLQDTPDHDRLWFEQRPPRDFDLDS
jgi:hypothetical protein